ncbi:MAG: hypothetical protein ACRDOY_08155 [Nocardioidaceae bacterium]
MRSGLATGKEPATHPQPSPPRGLARGLARDAVVVLGCYVLLGAVCGVIWWLLVEPAMFTKVARGSSMEELELGKRFNAVGWYSVIAAVAGLAAGVVVTGWRSRDFLLTTCLIFGGSGLAGALMALTGYVLGPGEPDVALATAAVGDQAPIQLEVTARAAYLVWPAATLIGALVVLWSPPKDTGD